MGGAVLPLLLPDVNEMHSVLCAFLVSKNLSDFSITEPFTLLSNFGSYVPGGGASPTKEKNNKI